MMMMMMMTMTLVGSGMRDDWTRSLAKGVQSEMMYHDVSTNMKVTEKQGVLKEKACKRRQTEVV